MSESNATRRRQRRKTPDAWRKLGRSAALLLALVGAAVAVLPASALAQSANIGYRDQHFSGTGTAVTGAKPESKLWFNDGSWWASMWDETLADNYIFRRNAATETWVNTGVVIDTRGGTRADALWDGTKLYVASHGFSNTGSAGLNTNLYRYSYDPVAKRYTPDPGFPVAINNWRSESLVLAKDSTGKLWATWVQNGTVMVNRTVGDDRTWGTPFALAVARASGVTPDDISSIVAFDGNKIGVMWSDQATWTMNFSLHVDGDPDGAWSPTEAALDGNLNADDHISLKADANGRVYAAVKTSQTDGQAPLQYLLVRDPLLGTWSRAVFGRTSDHHTRPIVLLDEQHKVVHMLATSGEAGGTVYEKTAPMSAISFESGLGTPFIRDGASADMNDPTSTKQNIDGQTGLVVMASNDTTGYYWHNAQSLGAAPLGADFSASPTSGDAPLAVRFFDLSSGSPTSWAWDFENDGTVDSTEQSPSHTYTTAGTYSIKLTVTDASGAVSSRTRSNYVSAQPLIAGFSASPTSGTAPLAVAFADTSTGDATTWAWDFDNNGTVDSTARNPSHTYSTPGTYTVSLSVTDASGNADTETRADYIVVSKPSGQLTFRPSQDAYVRSLSPTTNYGTATSLRVKNGGATGETYTTYMKFAVSGVTAPITAATLRLYVTDPAANGGQLFHVGPDSWSESALTWNNAPPPEGGPLADLGAVALDTWVEVPLPRSEFTAGNGTYGFAVKSPNAAAGTAWYSSREGTQQPQLVLTTASDTGPVTADFTASPTHGDAPLTVAFSDLSSGSPAQWSWDFGDGTTSTAQSPSHTYATPGTYTVTLTVTDANGNTNTKTRTDFVIVEALAADFSATPTSGFAPLQVSFTDRSTGLATGWRWDFGDGSTSTDRNPAHAYAAAGSYTVKLTVTDAAGNTHTTTKEAYITALEPVGGQVTANPVADAYVHSLNPTTNYGTKGTLRVRNGGTSSDSYRSYLRFDVTGLTGPVTAAKLRVFVTDSGSDAGDLYAVSDTSWTETGLTWNNAPLFSGTPARASGAATLNTWVEFTLATSIFTAGNGPYGFVIAGRNSEVVWYGSRETTTPPQLVLTSGG